MHTVTAESQEREDPEVGIGEEQFCIMPGTEITIIEILDIETPAAKDIEEKASHIKKIESCDDFFSPNNKFFPWYVTHYSTLKSMDNTSAASISQQIDAFIVEHPENQDRSINVKPGRYDMGTLIGDDAKGQFMYGFSIGENVFLKNGATVEEGILEIDLGNGAEAEYSLPTERVCSTGSLNVQYIVGTFNKLGDTSIFVDLIQSMNFRTFFSSNFPEYVWYIKNYTQLEQQKHRGNEQAHIIVCRIENFLVQCSNSDLVHPKMRRSIKGTNFQVRPMKYNMGEMGQEEINLLGFEVSVGEHKIICRNGAALIHDEIKS